jgi:hypothetical protein
MKKKMAKKEIVKKRRNRRRQSVASSGAHRAGAAACASRARCASHVFILLARQHRGVVTRGMAENSVSRNQAGCMASMA